MTLEAVRRGLPGLLVLEPQLGLTMNCHHYYCRQHVPIEPDGSRLHLPEQKYQSVESVNSTTSAKATTLIHQEPKIT